MTASVRSLDVLAESECRELLAGTHVGRLSFWDGRVEVLPVCFLVREDAVVFRTGSASRLAGLPVGAEVVLEVDDVEPALRTGWSVTVRGALEVVADDALGDLPDRLVAWAPGERDCFRQIPLAAVSGRRIVPAGPAGLLA